MKKKKILITGATGFIGSAFVKKYSKIYDIYSISKSSAPLKDLVKDHFFLDLNKPDSLNALNKLDFEVIFHLSGQSSELKSFDDPYYDFNSNVVSTINLLEICKKKI